MLTLETWQVVVFVFAIMAIHTVFLVVTAKVIGKGLSSKLVYLLPFYPFDTSKRIYALSQQLNVPMEDITYTGKSLLTGRSEYYVKSLDSVYTVKAFFGIAAVNDEGTIANPEYVKFSTEHLTHTHKLLEEQAVEPLAKENLVGEDDLEGQNNDLGVDVDE